MLANTKQIRAVINQAIQKKNGCLVYSFTDVPCGFKTTETAKRYVAFCLIGKQEGTLQIAELARKLAKNAGYTNPIRCKNGNIRTVAYMP
jgi:competence transcription factor ComK